jgi:hypothetical protein
MSIRHNFTCPPYYSDTIIIIIIITSLKTISLQHGAEVSFDGIVFISRFIRVGQILQKFKFKYTQHGNFKKRLKEGWRIHLIWKDNKT